MRETVFIVWSDEYSLGSPTLDQQHKRLFELINSLYEAMQRGVEQNQLKDLLQMLEQYAQHHFDEEEQAMAEVKYPDIVEQRKAHRYFGRRIMEFKHQMQREDLFPRDILVFMKDWLVAHILNMDQKITPFIAAATEAEKTGK